MIHEFKSNPDKSSTTKIKKSFSIFTISSFKDIENKHDVCRIQYFMKKFCESLREHAIKITQFKKKKK